MSFLLKKLFRIIAVIYVFVFAYLWAHPTNDALLHPAATFVMEDHDVEFLSDETFLNAQGEREVRQEIWDRIFSLVNGAQRFVLLDMFLFNDFEGAASSVAASGTRPLSLELTDLLVEKRVASPHVPIVLLTDPINTVYGGVVSPDLERLRKAGVLVVETDLTQLPDSNLLWSTFWRPCCSWGGNTTDPGLFPHPFQWDGQSVTLRSWLTLVNFKANHRKLLIADQPINEKGKVVGSKVVSVVSSSNPHDGSSMHGNVALVVGGDLWRDIFENESVIAELSNSGLPVFGGDYSSLSPATGTLRVSYLREKAIRDKALAFINGTKKGDEVDLVMFYLSERAIVRALADASDRGVQVRVVLDPNKDAFGRKKNGIPNRPVAKELISRSDGDIVVRWCDTHGEQCHAKLLLGKTATGTFLMLGSANYTRRNIGGYNLEGNVAVESNTVFSAWADAHSYVERLWKNQDGQYTVGYEVYQDDTLWKSGLYRFMEWSGVSSF